MGKNDRLKQARIAQGYSSATEAAHRFGWRPTTYAGHENGSRGFGADQAGEYARAFRVAPEWILFGRGDQAPQDASPPPGPDALLPVYNVQASAGHGALIDGEEIVSSVAFPPGYLRRLTKANPANLAIIGVKGDSMVPTLSDDDIVMLDTSKRDLSYDGLFVIRDNGAGLLIKRIGRATKAGHVMVISDNRALYPEVERGLGDFEVIGKVIWTGRKV